MPTVDELLTEPGTDLSDPIALCAQGQFRWGPCQAILYDPTRSDIFPQPFLYSLYERTRLSGQRHPQPLNLTARTGLGSLPLLFCGMTNLGPDAICKFLAERALCIVGEWRPGSHSVSVESGELICEEDNPVFMPLGYCFPSSTPTTTPLTLTGIPSNSVFAGYTIFSEVWRRPQQEVLMWLGLAWLFHYFQLAWLHGSRYETNHLTARWTQRFGFRDCGILPGCLTSGDDPTGPLVPGVFSTLAREEFAGRLRAVLTAIRKEAIFS